jgi:hypothetical protein
MGFGKMDTHMHYIQTSKDLNVILKILEVLEENIGKILYDIVLGKDFWISPQSKNRQIGLHPIKKLLHNKGNNKQRDNLQNGRKYMQIVHLTRD